MANGRRATQHCAPVHFDNGGFMVPRELGSIGRLATFAATALCLVALFLPARLGYGQISDEALVRQISAYANDLCGVCHEPRGGKELAPRISGQQRDYIEAQLNAFRRKSRVEPEAYDCMWGLSSALSDRLTAALASYFASQPARPGIAGDSIRVQAGAALFTRDRQNGIPSCAQCHEQDAAGAGTVPRLAGQLAPYLGRQMQVIRARFRESGIMHGILTELTDEEMRSLAVYLQSL